MDISLEDAARFVVAVPTDPILAEVLQTAIAMVDDFLSENLDDVPESTLRNAYLTQTYELWIRRNNPGGAIQTTDEGPVRYLSTDPMRVVKSMLAKWKPLGACG